ncbi:hypothetical protein H6G33_37220 [Calothrix sp. FACHB-1219]|uniref:hypothetical protein n=1 Tax=Calothrix sp. FACHB-168 TaxID=2692780 RepID=UPI001682055B|nr:hypothetical protein [Calothrix sp. FACHB-168]MBD2222570.1 hypothetical protein [Calothrix sp. FACHB-1219]
MNHQNPKFLVNEAKFWDNLTASPPLFDGLLLYSSERGGGYAVFVVATNSALVTNA